eukprot:1296677-Amphidinium_carterae.1
MMVVQSVIDSCRDGLWSWRAFCAHVEVAVLVTHWSAKRVMLLWVQEIAGPCMDGKHSNNNNRSVVHCNFKPLFQTLISERAPEV